LIRAERLAEVIPRLMTQDHMTAAKTSVASAPGGGRGRAVAILIRDAGLAAALVLGASLETRPALAVPAFAIQTSQPCATCHVGAFGPQLTPQGRDFKLHGYLNSDSQDHGLPLAWVTQTSFTHTEAQRPGGAAPGFRANDNIALDSVAGYYAGKITPEVGGFIKFRYNPVRQQAQLGSVDIRDVREGELFGKDALWGLTVNNSPTVQDPWNSTPWWGFPYVRSSLAPTPVAAPLVNGGLGQRVAGAGFYMLWNDLLYLEGDGYKGLDSESLRTVGQMPINGSDRTTAFLPYARLAVIRDWQSHHVEVGAFALSADVIPGRNQTFGVKTSKTDTALDATYQYITDPTRVTSDRLSAHATYIHETATMGPSPAQTLTHELLEHTLDTTRFDISYSFAATVTPSIQYFRTTATTDIRYWGTPNGSPNSNGMIFEVAYVPWGKPDAPFPNVNVRLTAQYVSYFTFNGTASNAHNNNNFFFGFQTAFAF
jgi:hypothetical protein